MSRGRAGDEGGPILAGVSLSRAGWRLESAWLAACLADAGGVRRGRRCVACMSTGPGGMRRVGVCGSALVSRGTPRARPGAAHGWEETSAGVRGCAVHEGAWTRVVVSCYRIHASLEGWHRIDVWTGVVCLSGRPCRPSMPRVGDCVVAAWLSASPSSRDGDMLSASVRGGAPREPCTVSDREHAERW